MTPLFRAAALTLFPEMFPGPLGVSLAGTALEKGIWSLNVLDIRDFATDKHRTVDAPPYGGGSGMVMKPDVVSAAVEAAKIGIRQKALGIDNHQIPTIIYPSPRGISITQSLIESLKTRDLIFVCGRFEGLDQRVIDHHEMLEVSLGDFVLSGGELAAMAILDAIVRLLPGVIGNEGTLGEESFSFGQKSARLLEYPHYTRPPMWNGMAVPDVLLSGNHKQINQWRLEQAQTITAARRPDLIQKEG